jgi:hypothetical protein
MRDMKKTGIAILIFLSAAVGMTQAEGAKEPKIAVKELRFDFGQVEQGKQVSHVFEVMNEGTETLVIQKVQTA